MKHFASILILLIAFSFKGSTQTIDINKPVHKQPSFIGTYAFVNKGKPRNSYSTINLKSDSTVITTFSADMGTETLTGNWHLSNDTVRIKLNPVYGQDKKPYFNHSQENMTFKISGAKLIPVIAFEDKMNKKTSRKINRILTKAAFQKIKDKES